MSRRNGRQVSLPSPEQVSRAYQQDQYRKRYKRAFISTLSVLAVIAAVAVHFVPAGDPGFRQQHGTYPQRWGYTGSPEIQGLRTISALLHFLAEQDAFEAHHRTARGCGEH